MPFKLSGRQVKLDEGLMSSGRLADALNSLLDWLAKAEAYLVEDQPVYGDLDTVNILIEKHKVRGDGGAGGVDGETSHCKKKIVGKSYLISNSTFFNVSIFIS